MSAKTAPKTGFAQSVPPLSQPRPPGPRAVAVGEQAAPQGNRVAGNLGPGSLYPGVGTLVQRTGQPHRCGTMSGMVFDFLDHPNSRNPQRVSTRFAGDFVLVTHTATVLRGRECYFPPTITRALKAALGLNPSGQPVPVSIEVWCEPDAEGRPKSPLGYSYGTYDRMPVRDNDPLLALAYEAGILERPMLALQGGGDGVREGETVDAETGEISRPAASAA